MMFTIIIISCLVLTINGLPVENTNPELLGGGFEGDILLPPNFNQVRGAAYSGEIHRWPKKIIPYDLSAITNAADRTAIKDAMNTLMFDVGTPIPGQLGREVCVFFRPAQIGDQQILYAKYGNGCSATIGYGNYQKSLNLQPNGCFRSGTIQHELVHVLGFFHEQSRPDRDSFITVHLENIDPSQRFNFEKYQWDTDIEKQNTNYDYGSLMHYPRDAFTANGLPTITPYQINAVIGQREKLSPTDISEIRQYYKC